MQEIITWMVIAAASVFLLINVMRILRLFKRPDPCKGCGSACENCPVYLKKK
jgi:hypothetical protein